MHRRFLHSIGRDLPFDRRRHPHAADCAPLASIQGAPSSRGSGLGSMRARSSATVNSCVISSTASNCARATVPRLGIAPCRSARRLLIILEADRQLPRAGSSTRRARSIFNRRHCLENLLKTGHLTLDDRRWTLALQARESQIKVSDRPPQGQRCAVELRDRDDLHLAGLPGDRAQYDRRGIGGQLPPRVGRVPVRPSRRGTPPERPSPPVHRTPGAAGQSCR